MIRDRKAMRWFCGGLTLFLAAVVATALYCGSVRVPLTELTTSPVMQLRMARVMLAILAGASLSVAGTVLQALMRNPLAEPYLLGVSSGAGVAVAITIFAGWNLSGIAGVAGTPLVAFFGAMATLWLVCTLARQRDGSTPVGSLLLSGAVLNAVLGSVLIFIVSVASSENLHLILWWMLGNLQIFDIRVLAMTAVVNVIGIGFCLGSARNLNLISLGDETASQLGLEARRVRRTMLIATSMLTAGTIAACGLIGFVGLIVPHTARLIVGSDHHRLLPVSVLMGAIFLTVADTLARTMMATEIPIGVMTALCGGPFFLYLLRTRQ